MSTNFLCYFADMAWPTKGSGRSYNSNCGFTRLVGGYLKRVITSLIFCRVCRICKVAERMKKKAQPHTCVKNYEGSLKGMESAACLEIAVSAPSQGFVLAKIVSDNDSTMRAHLK